MVYVDTSLLVSFYVVEPRSAAVTRRIADELVYVSWLTGVEIASALSKKVREGHLTKPEAASAERMYREAERTKRFRRVKVKPGVRRTARLWIMRLDTSLRTVDAMHLAIAAGEGVPLLTADTKLADAARIIGVAHEFLATP